MACLAQPKGIYEAVLLFLVPVELELGAVSRSLEVSSFLIVVQGVAFFLGFLLWFFLFAVAFEPPAQCLEVDACRGVLKVVFTAVLVQTLLLAFLFLIGAFSRK